MRVGPDLFLMLTLFLLAGMVLGGGLTIVGLRGGRLGDDPVCNNCGFNLSGKPRGVICCAECGSDLGEFNAVGYGELRRHLGRLTFGLVLLCVCVVSAGLDCLHINLHHAPTVWVIYRLGAMDNELRSAAFAELKSRISSNALDAGDWNNVAEAAISYTSKSSSNWDPNWASVMKKARTDHHITDEIWTRYLGNVAERACGLWASGESPAFGEIYDRTVDRMLGPEDVHVIAERALLLQGDLTRIWQPRWGDWLENRRNAGKISFEQWLRYLNQSWKGAFSIALRQQVRRGDPLPFSLDYRPTRTGLHTNLCIHVSDIQLSWKNAAKPIAANIGEHEFITRWNFDCKTQSCLPAGSFPAGIGDGLQNIHINAQVQVGPDVGTGIEALAAGQIDVPGAFTLLPSTQSSVRTAALPPWGENVSSCITMPAIEITHDHQPRITGTVTVTRRPVGIAFDVLVRAGNRQMKLGSFAYPAVRDFDRDPHSFWTSADWFGDVPKKVDVILQSNPVAATYFIGTSEAWDGQIVFRDVPVR